jgi:hypothetical protein
VTLYLLGAWQGLAAAAGYWIGSSAGSQDKSNQIAAMANTAAVVSAKALQRSKQAGHALVGNLGAALTHDGANRHRLGMNPSGQS